MNSPSADILIQPNGYLTINRLLQNDQTNRFWQYDADYWFKKLNSSLSGLGQTEANQIFLSTGQGRKHDSRLKKDFFLFLQQFKSPLMLLLLGAVALSAFLGDTSDVFIILFIVLSTGILSFFSGKKCKQGGGEITIPDRY